MLYYGNIAIKALRLDELKGLILDIEATREQVAEALTEGHRKYMRDFEEVLLKVVEDVPEGNKEIVHEFIVNNTKLIIPPRT